MPVYDPEKTEELAPGSHDDLGVHPEHAEAEKAQLERDFENSPNEEPPDNPSGSWWARRKQKKNAAEDAESLQNKEERPESKYDNSALGDMQERLGLGFTGKGSDKSKALSKAFSSNSKIKKRLAVAAAAAGVGGGGTALVFFLMLPLKVESFVNMIEGRAMASTQDTMQKGLGHAFSRYLGKHVMAALGTPGCKKSIDPGCVVVVPGTNPVAKMYQAWAQGKLQQELGSKHGIIIGKDERSGKFYMTVNGHGVGNDEQFRKLQKGDITIFDLDAKEVKRSDIRRALNTALKEGTLWDRTYKRYQYGKLLEKRYHIKRCLIACDVRDTFNESKDSKLLAGKLWLTQKVSGVAGETYGLLLDCVVDPAYCDSKLTVSTEPDEEPKSRFHRELDAKLAAYIAGPGRLKLSELTERAKLLGELGPGGYMAVTMAEKLGKIFGLEAAGEVTEKVVTKAVPIVGWASLAIDIKAFIKNAPSFIAFVRYSTTAATSVSTFAMYQSAAGEMKSGHVDSELIGSLADTLSDKQDMTSHPLYESYLGVRAASSGPSLLGSLLSKITYAEDGGSTAFKCDDGNPVPQGRQSCLEEDLSYPGELAETSKAALDSPIASVLINSPVDPALNVLNGIYKGIAGIIGTAAQWALEGACVGPCADFMQWVGKNVGELFTWLVDEMLPNPWKNLSGGRLLAMSTAGAEVGYEKAAMLKIGARPITSSAYLDIQRQYLEDEQANFREKSFVARLTDTSSPYSMTSRMALSLPSRASMAPEVASIITSPLQRVGSVFGSLLTTKRAEALTVGSASPFGVKHYGYSDAEIPSDPEQYWNDHCEGRNFEQEFLNKMVQDPNTGEATPNQSEPCLLIRTMAESAGGMFDASLLPAGSTSTSGSTATSLGSSTIDTQHMFDPSESVGCAPGTRDLGLQDGYSSGQKVIIRVCAIPGFKSSAYESGAESEYALQGADGDVIVNSRVSGAWLSLYSAAKTSGVTLSATSGFRTMKKQKALWIEFKEDSRRAAEPGYSPHQMGLAIDFATIRNMNLGAQSCNVRVKEPGNVYWEWLEKNAARFGFKQYSAEAWHWDPLQKSNRCGGGG